ncbi:SLAP domain-containing protein [Alkalibacillus flavidus]|uniref:SLAP domain-containing protein n=1 Tax=Alkalibacillus flavidus TaxID=546021 RepID=A0ABV2KUE7_9BACI
MQRLMFEPKWDKTIADQDRKWIKAQFNQLIFADDSSIQFTILKHAYNHRNHLLVTVLIHNLSDQPVRLDSTIIDWANQATGTFTVPIDIQAKHSMPWTFIFTDYKTPIDEDDELVIRGWCKKS